MFCWTTDGPDILSRVVFVPTFLKFPKIIPSFSAPDPVSRSETMRLSVSLESGPKIDFFVVEDRDNNIMRLSLPSLIPQYMEQDCDTQEFH